MVWNTLSFYVTAPVMRYESAEHHSRPARVHESRWRRYLCLIRWFMTNEIYSTFDQGLSAKLHVSHDFVVVFSIAAKLIAWVESAFLLYELINCFLTFIRGFKKLLTNVLISYPSWHINTLDMFDYISYRSYFTMAVFQTNRADYTDSIFKPCFAPEIAS